MWLCVVKLYIVRRILNEVAAKTSQRTTKGLRKWKMMLSCNLWYTHSYRIFLMKHPQLYNILLTFFFLIRSHYFNKEIRLGLSVNGKLYKGENWDRNRYFSCRMKLKKKGTGLVGKWVQKESKKMHFNGNT